ncbi:MAG: zf-TFIIB domain-containing protein [Marinicella sp.]|nr:zf-TFIIB domain-containing protein [Xanthomonadales bacterium]
MQCPHDQSQLKLIQKNNAYGYHCTLCEGVLLHGKSVKVFKQNYFLDIIEVLKSQESIQSELACPACHQLLFRKIVDGIELDSCEQCSGIWFDAKELNQIIRNHVPIAGSVTLWNALVVLFGSKSDRPVK